MLKAQLPNSSRGDPGALSYEKRGQEQQCGAEAVTG